MKYAERHAIWKRNETVGESKAAMRLTTDGLVSLHIMYGFHPIGRKPLSITLAYGRLR